MFSCQKLWFLVFMAIFVENQQLCAQPVAQSSIETNSEAVVADIKKLSLITDDIISDKVENGNKKVIRINPLELPALKEDPKNLNIDSSVYKIQSLNPYTGKRKYSSVHRTKPQINIEAQSPPISDTPVITGLSLLPSPGKALKPKHQPKKKHLHFLYNQDDLTGKLLSKTMRVHAAPGAYPVYYVVSKTNGRFGKYPLKSFDSTQAFMKYLKKNKIHDSPA